MARRVRTFKRSFSDSGKPVFSVASHPAVGEAGDLASLPSPYPRASRLLPQPGGCERPLGGCVEVRSGDQSPIDRIDHAAVHLDPRVAAMRLASLVKDDHYLARSRVEDLVRLVQPVVIRLHPGGAELKGLQASKRWL